jgi:hypothetical protein
MSGLECPLCESGMNCEVHDASPTMTIEITEELAIELADAHAQAYSSMCCDGDTITNYFALVEAVGRLLVFIPDPRAPKPVERLSVEPRRGKLTKHQREVYDFIVRVSRRRGPDRYVWINESSIGSRGACNKLVEKGWVESKVEYGPRGGEYFSYRPIVDTPEVQS